MDRSEVATAEPNRLKTPVIVLMSLVHTILVGHFDLSAFGRRDPRCVRPLDMELITPILNRFELPAGEEVRDEGGYLSFRWMGSQSLLDLIQCIARAEDCYAVEMSNYEIMYYPADTSGEWPD